MKKQFIVKWVDTDSIFNYYPCALVFKEYNKAKDYKTELEEKIEAQEKDLEELFEGKIISEIYLEEINIECQSL